MSFINLSVNECVNVGIIDSQHIEIAETINELNNYVLSEVQDNCNELFKKLIDEIEIHFETEETLMKQNKFPGYITHKLEHDRFYKQLLRDIDSHYKSISSFNQETLNGLKRWLINHIEINDKKCGEYFNSIGIK